MTKQTHKRQQVQAAVIEALAAGKSVPEAAAVGSVHPSSVYRWLDHPDFIAALARARGEPTQESGNSGRYSSPRPYLQTPEVQEAGRRYMDAARREHGPHVPMDREGVPDPRWCLQYGDAGTLGRSVARAASEYERVRRAALLRWRSNQLAK